ncbi:MAG: hydrogenase maturation nickel metallochaperone HypA [Oscillospiraceae bacterium]|nr:hydrogenase maturation nickel metallochaperone HypA [Oscillospiraceae bacterium]
MHELGLTDALLRMVRDVAKKEALTHVEKITLEIGELSGVVPRYMLDCWQAVVDGTEYADTELVIESVPGIASCMDCDEEFRIDINSMRCPFCGSHNLTPVSGRDMIVKEIEAW